MDESTQSPHNLHTISTQSPHNLLGVGQNPQIHFAVDAQGDIYVLVKMRARDDTITIDTNELLDARWMSREHLQSIVAGHGQTLQGKVSEGNWKMIQNALDGSVIQGTMLPARPGAPTPPSMLYTAPNTAP